MMDPVRELKVRAEILHHAVRASEPVALQRLRVLRDPPTSVRRKHCLAAVAREAGFGSWEHARRVFEGNAAEVDFGTLLYAGLGGAQLNHWFASYDEARAFHEETSGTYLLAYKRHFFVVDRHFIESLGLDPDDADWEAIGHDWARPASVEARRRLYGRLLARE